MDNTLTTASIIYYNEDSLELRHLVKRYPKNESGRVVIPPEFKEDKSIVVVCLDEIIIANKVGDRIMSIGFQS